MKNNCATRILSALLLLGFFTGFAVVARAKERRVALVLGNGNYIKGGLLKNPPNDAQTLARTLAELGFDVTARVNVSQREMKSLIRDFGAKLQNADVGLFYYAGHGVQINGRNYLIPVDAQISREADVDIECVEVGSVLAQMENTGSRTNIIILDACRNNPLPTTARSYQRGLAVVNRAPIGTFIAYATAPDSVADDGTGQNGLYTQELLGALREPQWPIEKVFKRVRTRVKELSGGAQVPWDSSSLEGEFYFNPAGLTAATPDTSGTGHSSASPLNSGTTSSSAPSGRPVSSTPSVTLEKIERSIKSNLFEDALRDAQTLVTEQPQNGQAHAYLGLSSFLLGRFQEGAPSLIKAASLGAPVLIPAYRHRIYLTNEGLEQGFLTIQAGKLALHFGDEVIQPSSVKELYFEQGGEIPTPRVHLKLVVPEKNGKTKDRVYNLYSREATLISQQKDSMTIRVVSCNSCRPWATVVTQILNASLR